ncbi:MAG: hypothetical protein O3A10_01125 [Chloroflexi bacterium]|nr:hypothetical protein [Chloroflexota bacterium]MDA1147227.1 hypothetical protein [Chloroflexota bacterium]
MATPERHCIACRRCGAPEGAPWHENGASAEFNFRFEPCRLPLKRLHQRPAITYVHDGACAGVQHAPLNRTTERRTRESVQRARMSIN